MVVSIVLDPTHCTFGNQRWKIWKGHAGEQRLLVWQHLRAELSWSGHFSLGLSSLLMCM